MNFTIFDLKEPDLQWKGNIPISLGFDDPYFSIHGGQKETEYVFIEGNDLRNRLLEPSLQPLVIGELGFGTGLNLMTLYQFWKDLKASGAAARPITFVSFELYPFKRETLSKLHTQMELDPLFSKPLLDAYPEDLFFGLHSRSIDNSGFNFHFFIGDAQESLKNFSTQCDAWFLDGFSPAKNPLLWNEDILKLVALKTILGGTIASYTAAGHVRRSLESCGFEIEKKPGFANKRECISGVLKKAPTPPRNEKPWFHFSSPALRAGKVAVIGAGLAGSASAERFARGGFEVHVFEEQDAIASKASGNPIGIIEPLITATRDSLSEMTLAAYNFFFQHIKSIGAEDLLNRCGSVLIGTDEKEKKKSEDALASGYLNLSTFSKNSDGHIFLKTTGVISPTDLCKRRLEKSKNIKVFLNTKIKSIKKDAGFWTLETSENILKEKYEIVIFANSFHSTEISELDFLPIRKVRGQLLSVPENVLTKVPDETLSFDGYLTPSLNGKCTLGATYGNGVTTEVPLESESIDLLNRLELVQKNSFKEKDQKALLKSVTPRVSFRAMSPDVRPMVGPVPRKDFFIQNYAELSEGRKRFFEYPLAESEKGLFVITALGSRGIIYSGYFAEYLYSLVTKEPSPLTQLQMDAIHPARFLIKNFKKPTLTP